MDTSHIVKPATRRVNDTYVQLSMYAMETQAQIALISIDDTDVITKQELELSDTIGKLLSTIEPDLTEVDIESGIIRLRFTITYQTAIALGMDAYEPAELRE
jgi:hypothetical protein